MIRRWQNQEAPQYQRGFLRSLLQDCGDLAGARYAETCHPSIWIRRSSVWVCSASRRASLRAQLWSIQPPSISLPLSCITSQPRRSDCKD